MTTEKTNARQASLERAAELKKRAQSYLENRAKIPSGLELTSQLEKKRDEYLDFFQGTQEQWDDWHWQLRNRITDTETLGSLLPLTPEQRENIEKVGKDYRWAVSPYYLSLIDENNPNDPILLQSIPSVEEILDTSGEADPMGEEFTNP